MVAASHLIWTAYGWWLPNDPRGSNSSTIRAPNLIDLGDIHYGRKQIQPAGDDIRAFYLAAAGQLKFPLLTFSNSEMAVIGDAIQTVIAKREYTCYACAVMPDHVHILVRKHRDKPEEMILALQDESRETVLSLRDTNHPVWGGPGWKVYQETADDIRRTVRYIEDNPVKIGRPRQTWGFVRQYDGWLPGRTRFKKNT